MSNRNNYNNMPVYGDPRPSTTTLGTVPNANTVVIPVPMSMPFQRRNDYRAVNNTNGYNNNLYCRYTVNTPRRDNLNRNSNIWPVQSFIAAGCSANRRNRINLLDLLAAEREQGGERNQRGEHLTLQNADDMDDLIPQGLLTIENPPPSPNLHSGPRPFSFFCKNGNSSTPWTNIRQIIPGIDAPWYSADTYYYAPWFCTGLNKLCVISSDYYNYCRSITSNELFDKKIFEPLLNLYDETWMLMIVRLLRTRLDNVLLQSLEYFLSSNQEFSYLNHLCWEMCNGRTFKELCAVSDIMQFLSKQRYTICLKHCNEETMQIYNLLGKILDPDSRKEAVDALSKVYTNYPEFAVMFWNMYGSMESIIADIIHIYPRSEYTNLGRNSLWRTYCNYMSLLQTIAIHEATKYFFVTKGIPLFIYPLLLMKDKDCGCENIRIYAINIIGEMVTCHDLIMNDFLIMSNVIDVCCKCLEFCSEESAIIAVYIVYSLLCTTNGMKHICRSVLKLKSIIEKMGKYLDEVVHNTLSEILNYILLSFLKLAQNERGNRFLCNYSPALLREEHRFKLCFEKNDLLKGNYDKLMSELKFDK